MKVRQIPGGAHPSVTRKDLLNEGRSGTQHPNNENRAVVRHAVFPVFIKKSTVKGGNEAVCPVARFDWVIVVGRPPDFISFSVIGEGLVKAFLVLQRLPHGKTKPADGTFRPVRFFDSGLHGIEFFTVDLEAPIGDETRKHE